MHSTKYKPLRRLDCANSVDLQYFSENQFSRKMRNNQDIRPVTPKGMPKEEVRLSMAPNEMSLVGSAAQRFLFYRGTNHPPIAAIYYLRKGKVLKRADWSRAVLK